MTTGEPDSANGVATRIRACGAVFHQDRILMVRHIHDGRDYWTLRGGRNSTAYIMTLAMRSRTAANDD